MDNGHDNEGLGFPSEQTVSIGIDCCLTEQAARSIPPFRASGEDNAKFAGRTLKMLIFLPARPTHGDTSLPLHRMHSFHWIILYSEVIGIFPSCRKFTPFLPYIFLGLG